MDSKENDKSGIIVTSSGAGCICDYTNTKSPLYTLYTLEWCTLSGYMVYTFEKCLEKKTFIPTPKYKYTWHEWNMQKAQLELAEDSTASFTILFGGNVGVGWLAHALKRHTMLSGGPLQQRDTFRADSGGSDDLQDDLPLLGLSLAVWFRLS